MQTADPVLSLVVPVCGESHPLSVFLSGICSALGALPFEVVAVDLCPSGLPATLAEAMVADPRIRALTYKGHAADGDVAGAVLEGMRRAHGEYIAVFQSGPAGVLEVLPELVTNSTGADLVVAVPAREGAVLGGAGRALQRLGRRAIHGAEAALAETLFSRARACDDPLSQRFLLHRSVVADVDLHPESDALLLEILVRGKWSRLVEVPVAGESAAAPAEDSAFSARERVPAYFGHLRALRFTGQRGDGLIRTKRVQPALGPYDPEPLDDELPEKPALIGARGRRLLWTIALLALALRLVLLPIGHWWDLTVDYNTFIDLIKGNSPYDTLRYLSNYAQSAQWGNAYEYWAYPPIMLYIYGPLAHIFGTLHPHADYFFPVSGAMSMPRLPIDFYLWLKLPMWVADFLIAALLARMTGTIRGARDYLLNPYVLLISAAWTFDSVMVLGLVAGVYWLQRGKFAWSGLALAFGTMVKFVPAIAVPTGVLYLIKKKRPLHEIAIFVCVYAVSCLIFLGPYFKGLLSVLSFHSARVGGGMNWEVIWELYTLFPSTANLKPIQYAIGAFGTPTLIIVMLLAYWYAYTTDMSFNRMMLVTVLGFLIGSKLVNEQYALSIFPFALIEAQRLEGAWRWFYRAFWIIPLLFAVFNVPIDRFLWLFYHTVLGSRADIIATTGLTGFESPFIPWKHQTLDPVGILVFGVAFFVLCVCAIFWPTHTYRAPRFRFDRFTPEVRRRPVLSELARARTVLVPVDGVATSNAVEDGSPGAEAEPSGVSPGVSTGLPAVDAADERASPLSASGSQMRIP